MKKYIDVDFNCGMTIEEAVKYLRQLSYETGRIIVELLMVTN